MGKYSTPRVPHETPMYEVTPEGRQVLSRTWMIFFERLGRVESTTTTTPPGEAGPDLIWRTLLLKDTTVGDDIADHVTAQATGTAIRFEGVLRIPIIASLSVRIQKNAVLFVTLGIPAATPVDTVVSTDTFGDPNIGEGDVFSWDVTSSDGSVDSAGVASFTLYWETTPAAPV